MNKINLNIKTLGPISIFGSIIGVYIWGNEYLLSKIQKIVLVNHELISNNELLSLLVPLSLFIFFLVGLVIILRSLVKRRTKQLQAKVQEVKEVYNKYLDIIEEADNALFEWVLNENKLQIKTSFLEIYI